MVNSREIKEIAFPKDKQKINESIKEYNYIINIIKFIYFF